MIKLKKATMDGNEAAAYISYAFTEVAAIYPITPSSPMAEYVDIWAANGRKNIFGQTVKLIEMQSEAGAVSAMHGAMEAGVLTSSYTSSQGLLLMVPTMFRIAGHLKAGVIHVASRSTATHAYSIFAEHSDVMACRQTGFAILASSSVQEAMDLGAVAHLSSIKGSVPFLHFFDGFRTSHEIQKIDVLDYELLANLIDYNALKKLRKKALNPEYPVQRTTGQPPEIYFQNKESSNLYYDNLPNIVEEYLNKINAVTGKRYELFNYYGDKDAESIIIAMGSVSGTVQETIDYLNSSEGKKVGFLDVHLYRPFSIRHFLNKIPKTVKTVIVLDRTKEPGAPGEPLYEDVCSAFNDSEVSPVILAGRYGIGGKDTNPSHIAAVFKNAEEVYPKNHFTVGINDDITFRSIDVDDKESIVPEGTISCKFWGLGSDGTVGANKNTVKIIGDNTDKYVQAYFEYDGKKSGGITKSHLRFSDYPIKSSYYIKKADFIACHNQTYIHKYAMHTELKKGGTFLLNCSWNINELDENLPSPLRKYLADNKINLYIINADKIAQDIGIGNHTNTILQAAFFKISQIISLEEAVMYMKDSALKTYGNKGKKIIDMNYAAIDRGINEVLKADVPKSWSDITIPENEVIDDNLPEFVRNQLIPFNKQRGEMIPVSVFKNYADGSVPVGTSKYEKSGIAFEVPEWKKENCMQCNQCSYVCPHSTIRPFLLNSEEERNAPYSFKRIKAKGKNLEEFYYSILVDALDCMGCGSCADVCPAKDKALVMKPIDTQINEMGNWNYALKLSKKVGIYSKTTVKGSQFEQPLLEFPGACAGCGETPYAKLITQLFGDRMYIATATGCPLVWSTDYPSFPYTTNELGYGPAQSNSLFENNGEFGLGIALGVGQLRNILKEKILRLYNITKIEELKNKSNNWLNSFDDGNKSKESSKDLKNLLMSLSLCDEEKDISDFVIENSEHLVKKSIWIFGGDGWAYDIGYGGLDHVISSGEDVNILVLDTEVYSNTGGQASKATPKGAVAKFAASGRKTKKKDLGRMAMTYGNVYVAQVAMGADQSQLLKAVIEAEAYRGPSIIIAYAPCVNHGLINGMGKVQLEMKRAVQSGYWHLYRYNPIYAKEGKNPFVLDSKKPAIKLREFLAGEMRFVELKNTFPDMADKLIAEIEKEAEEKYLLYYKMANGEM